MNLQSSLPDHTPLNEEPWVKLDGAADLQSWGKQEEVAYNQVNRQSQKLAFYVNAFDFISSLGIQGDYFEFGCHRARTFRMALTEARRHNLSGMKFLAFDSFEGLPDPETATGVEVYFQGSLKTSEDDFLKLIRKHGLYTENIRSVSGYYSDSLTETLQNELLSKESQVAIVCVDCDLYESAVPVFSFLEPFLQEGTVIYIDDYFVGYKGSPVTGPAKAFHEFEQYSKFSFAVHMQVGWWGRSFIAYSEDGNVPI